MTIPRLRGDKLCTTLAEHCGWPALCDPCRTEWSKSNIAKITTAADVLDAQREAIEAWIEDGKTKGIKGTITIHQYVSKIKRRDGDLYDEGKYLPVEVEAILYGPLAIHKSGLNSYWKITHVPTGLSIESPIDKQSTARRFVFALRNATDWDRVRSDNVPHGMGMLIRRFRAYSLGNAGTVIDELAETILTLPLKLPD